MEKIGLEVSAQFDDVVIINVCGVESGTIVPESDSDSLTIYFQHEHAKPPVYYNVWSEDLETSGPEPDAAFQVRYGYGQHIKYAVNGWVFMTISDSDGIDFRDVHWSVTANTDQSTSRSYRGYWAQKDKITPHAFDPEDGNKAKNFKAGATYKWFAAFDE